MKRTVQPEILDSLPSDAPEAIWSRRDLRMINRLMGNYRWLSRQIVSSTTVIELGAGDGAITSHRALLGKTTVHGVDLAPRPTSWPEDWSWTQGDLFRCWPQVGEGSTVIANLFLHHFEEAELRQIGSRVESSGARRLLACEPARFFRHQVQGALLPILGINAVTRHDLHVSIRAGFRRGELGAFLGLDPHRWIIRERITFLGALRFEACRT